MSILAFLKLDPLPSIKILLLLLDDDEEASYVAADAVAVFFISCFVRCICIFGKFYDCIVVISGSDERRTTTIIITIIRNDIICIVIN